MENRILVLAPFGRDAQLILDALAARRINAHVCPDARALIGEIGKESAATILTEESLDDGTVMALREHLAQQPPWSDYPFVVLAARQTVRVQRALCTNLDGRIPA